MRTPTKPTERPDLVWAGRVQRLVATAVITGAVALSACFGDEPFGPNMRPPAAGTFAGTLFFNGSAYGVSGDVYSIDLP